MTHIKHLPTCLLEEVFKYITVKQDVAALRLVFLEWHSFFTKRLIEKVHLTNYTRFEDFMQLNKVSEQMRLTPVGQFIETIAIGTRYNGNYSDMLGIHMKFDDFMQLVDYCPNGICLMMHMPSFESCVAKYLLEIDDSIKWNLHYVDIEPTDEAEMSYYYKYKDSIKEIITPPDVEDL